MAYTVPERWTQGEYPTAAKLNKYKDAIDAIHDAMGDAPLFYPCIKNTTPDKEKGYYFVHTYRWLHYQAAGELLDPTGAGDSVSLSWDGTVNVPVYDLESIEWMRPGKLYEIKDVTFAAEDWEP